MRSLQDKILTDIESTVHDVLPSSIWRDREVVRHQASAGAGTGWLFVMLGPIAVLQISYSFGQEALRVEYSGMAADASTTLQSDHRAVRKGRSGISTYPNIPYLDAEAMRTKVYGMIRTILKEGVVMQRRGE